eukprot:TRINITY_DN49038_c0_g1_i1.p1 TRINITY_DN49038_c0_g1~~TRINITY_DN49038_c0_g1_i1.p1  ORF type:complete len:756 (-),score=128.08 TRINITY_DN49038_c0_g1_i1:1166-3121(-)
MLTSFLNYHIMGTEITGAQLNDFSSQQAGGETTGTFLDTLANNPANDQPYKVRVLRKDTGIQINNGMLSGERPALNGRLFVIDTLLMPPRCGFTNIGPEAFVWTAKTDFPGVKRRVNDGDVNTVWRNHLPRGTPHLRLQFKRAVDVCQIQIAWPAQMPTTNVAVWASDIDGDAVAQTITTVPGGFSVLDFPSKDTLWVGVELTEAQARFLSIAEIMIYEESASEGRSVYDLVAYDQPRFSWITASLHVTGVWKLLKEETRFSYTLFAPTDAAFNRLPPTVRERLGVYDTPTLTEIVLYHIVSTTVLKGELTASRFQFLTTLSGFDIYPARTGNWINNARYVDDVGAAENGHVHAIDQVLIPPNVDVITDGTVRLVGGDENTGRVEIYFQGQWGTVCDDGILTSIADGRRPVTINNGLDIDPNGPFVARTICRELGYVDGAISTQFNTLAQDNSQPIFIDELRCNERNAETRRIQQCTFTGPGAANNCDHREDIGVVCSREGQIRLNGPNPWSGRVEIYNNGQFGTMCSNRFGNSDAEVVCRQLGFHGGVSSSTFGTGGGLPQFNGVLGCDGSEDFVNDCTFSTGTTCASGEQAGVICTPFAEFQVASKKRVGGLTARIAHNARNPKQFKMAKPQAAKTTQIQGGRQNGKRF